KLTVRSRNGRWPLRKRTQIETGTAYNERQVAALNDLCNYRLCTSHPLSYAERLSRRYQIDQVVFYLSLLLGSRLGSTDIHAGIHLHGIGSYYLNLLPPLQFTRHA